MKIIVTGAAGFIGMHTSLSLLRRGDEVIGIDNLNNYYDVNLKNARISQLSEFKNFKFLKIDINDYNSLSTAFSNFNPDRVIHLAAQAGVRYSLENPSAYIDSNITGFMNILECSRHNNIEHLTYASSSSVYGSNKKIPFEEDDSVDHPVSLYAATKKANELMAHTYSHLFNLPTSGLRFFTVYGPWGRPDMALFLFTKSILNDEPINVFNHGEMIRDFTFIDDIVEGVIKVSDKVATQDPSFNQNKPTASSSNAPFRIFNIGNSNPVNLMEYIKEIENRTGKIAKKLFLPMQPGDVLSTVASTDKLFEWTGFKPKTNIENGIKQFIDWYLEFYEN